MTPPSPPRSNRRLLAHRSTSALHTKVSTADGVVTLSGIAKNAAEKSLVTKLVTDINGVTSVINNMTIAVPWRIQATKSESLLAGWREGAPAGDEQNKRKKNYMLYTIAVVLIILWLLGLVSGYAIGGFIHILLVIAVIMILVNLISGRQGRLKRLSIETKKLEIQYEHKNYRCRHFGRSGHRGARLLGHHLHTPGKPIDFLGMHIETTHSHFIPPVVGAIALIGGIVLLLVKPRQV